MARGAELPAVDDGAPSALADAFRQYRESGLRLPPVPRDLADRLEKFDDWRWGSDDLNLDDRTALLDAARTPGGTHAVAFGHVGHGASSWFLCDWLLVDALAVYVRLPYGGIYNDPAEDVPAINAVTARLEELIPAAAAAREAGRFQGGHRLIVVVDEKINGFWEIAGGPGGARSARDPLADALAFLGEPVLTEPEEEE